MTFDLHLSAGFLDARGNSATMPLKERADPLTSDLSPDGTKIAYLVDHRLRIFEEVYYNTSYTDYVPEWRFSSIRWSPSGRYLAATGVAPFDEPSWPKDIQPSRGDVPGTVYLIDLQAQIVRPLWAPEGTPRPPLPPERPAIQFVSWSPDEQYVLLRHPSVASGTDANGRDMFALEIATGAVTQLGIVLPVFSWIAWRAPHTLAYVEGLGFEPWKNKRVRIWSPETGFREVTRPDEVGISPSWDASGRILFVHAPASPVESAADAFRLAAFDPSTDRTTDLLSDPEFADHAVAVSDDGTALLVLRRHVDEPLLEMWTAAFDGTDAHPLWRFMQFWTSSDPYTREHAIYQGSGIFESVAWSR